MKRRIIKIVVLLLSTVWPPALQAVNSISYTATYQNCLSYGIDTLGGVTYRTIHYTGQFNGGEPGKPSLPIDHIRFSVPYNATNFTVSATLRNSHMAPPLNYLIYPCQQPRLMGDTTPVVITLPDSAAYNGNYPSQAAWVESEGFLAGENHIVTVAVMPVRSRYRTFMGTPVRSIVAAQTVDVTLSYELSDTLNLYPLVRKDSVLRREGYQLMQGLVVNPGDVVANAPSQTVPHAMMPHVEPLDSTNFYPTDSVYYDNSVAQWASSPYLIVTTQELKHSLRRLAALKRQKGYGVKIVTVEDVLNDSYASAGDVVQRGTGLITTFTDSAGKLRQYLKKAFRIYGTRYVLFAGSGVPFRICVFESIPSDLYYSELHKDWYSAIDNISGFDLAVGRLLGTTPQQFSYYTDKLLRYELNPGGGDFAYLKKVFCSESADFQKYHYFDYVNNQYELLFNDSTHVKESLTTDYPSGTDIINTLNETHHGYISMENHAGPSGWIVNGFRNMYDDRWPYYYLWAIDSIHYKSGNRIDTLDQHTGNGLNNLNNKKFPSILYSFGCSTTPFDKAPGYDSVKVCLGESFTMGKDYGGPAFLGHTREGSLAEYMSQIEFGFIKALNNGNSKIGEAESLSKIGIDKRLFKDMKCHNLIGDPEFEVWTDLPSMITGIAVERTDNSITVSGIDVDSVIVACYSNTGIVEKRLATSDTITFHYALPNSTVMLYKHNYIPFIAPLMLQNVTLNRSQYVIATDVTAGNSIDSIRTPGDVTIPVGVEYEIEASGIVRLEDGFKVEKGATFAVYPSSF